MSDEKVLLAHRLDTFFCEVDMVYWNLEQESLLLIEAKKGEIHQGKYKNSQRNRLLILANHFIEAGFSCECQYIGERGSGLDILPIET